MCLGSGTAWRYPYPQHVASEGGTKTRSWWREMREKRVQQDEIRTYVRLSWSSRALRDVSSARGAGHVHMRAGQ